MGIVVDRTFFFEHKGKKYLADVVRDDDRSFPWENEDGHGVIVVKRGKALPPGYRYLAPNCVYDFEASVQLALKDNWGTNNGDEEKAREAVEKDFRYLKDFCLGKWWYVGVAIRQIAEDGTVPDQKWDRSLWGIENTENKYHEEVARELADEDS